jgi:hypothetical protein
LKWVNEELILACWIAQVLMHECVFQENLQDKLGGKQNEDHDKQELFTPREEVVKMIFQFKKPIQENRFFYSLMTINFHKYPSILSMLLYNPSSYES